MKPFQAVSRLLGLPAMCLLTGCAAPTAELQLERHEYTSPHMGTRFRITLYAVSREQAAQAAQAAFDRVAQLEDILSDYMADSELMRLTRSPVGVPVPVSPDLFNVLERGAELSALTDGAFDLTTGPLTRLWRFSRKRGTLPSPPEQAAARAAVGWRSVSLDPDAQTATLLRGGIRLDAGGIAKGYAADEAMRVLATHGIDRALVAAGGDILAGLPPPGTAGWKVRIAEPAIPETGFTSAAAAGEARAVQTLSLCSAAVSTSGDTEQFVEIRGVRYSHIVSPFTGLGLTNRIQATVIAPDAATSDALATACCILGPERARLLIESMPGVSAVLLVAGDNDRRVLQFGRSR